MKLRRRFFLTLLALHLSLGLACGMLMWQDYRPHIFLLEALLLISLLLFQRLVKTSTIPLEIIADGSSFIRESEFSHTFVPTSSKEVNHLVSLYNELILKLREERHRLWEQHYFLEKVLAVSPAGILTFNPDHNIRYANPAGLKLLGAEAACAIDALDLPEALQLCWDELNEGHSRVISMGSQHRVRISRSTIQMEGFPCAVMILEELTHELLKSEKSAYEKLIRTLSHEINNSLGSSQSLLKSCLNWSHYLPEAEQTDFEQAISVVLERSQHLGQFMNSYAEVVRLPAPNLQPCDFREILDNVLTLQEMELRSKGIKILRDYSVGPWSVKLDRAQIEQVLINILRNAGEALNGVSEKSPQIVVSAKCGADFVQLKISDNGPGLSPQAQSHLFTPFFTTRPGGQGIGLTLVRDILWNHDLEFALENCDSGGACFSLRVILVRS